MSKFPLIDIRDIRIDKIEKLKSKGINPFPSKANRSHYIETILNEYEKHEGKEVIISGRLMSWRPHGKLIFGDVQDQTGRVQILISKDQLIENSREKNSLDFKGLKYIDIGDIVEVKGSVGKTRRQEISIIANAFFILTKSIRPLPDKWVGLKDREAILRRRYLDLITSPEHKKPFELISKMIHSIREFLNSKGFIEINTPVIQPQYGGGTAKPFITHVNALSCDMFLSISHELYLKRLIAAGFDKVYTIGKYFRNEGIDRSHHPEFSMIETMTAYENYEYNMDLVEGLFKYVAQKVFGKTKFMLKEHEIDIEKPWQRILLSDAVKNSTGVDFLKCHSTQEANNVLKKLNIEETQPSIGSALFKAFDDLVAPTLMQPTLVYGHPMDVSPLSKPMDTNPEFAERFEIIIGGMECGDNWSEQNDPLYLLQRWKQTLERSGENPEAFHPLDFDFIEVLEYGIPPTTGIGPGIERMAMIFSEQENIDDVIFFPLMKPVLSPLNAAIYNIDESPQNSVKSKNMVLDIDAFKHLLVDGALQLSSTKLVIRPYLKFWDTPTNKNSWRATGHIDIDGFSPEGLTISGYHIKSETLLVQDEEKKRFIDLINLEVIENINKIYSDCEITVNNTLA